MADDLFDGIEAGLERLPSEVARTTRDHIQLARKAGIGSLEGLAEAAGARGGEPGIQLAACDLLGRLGNSYRRSAEALADLLEREIGIRMAVGAKRLHIMMQFLIEAMTLSMVGGGIGVLFGVTAARLTSIIAGWPVIISGKTILTAFGFSLVVGLFFGLYPANKAARLNPIEALRYE